MTEVQAPIELQVSGTNSLSDVKLDISPTSDSGVVMASEANTPDTETAAGLTNPAEDTDSVVGNGPDEVVPAEKLYTWTGDESVKLRMGSGPLARAPISVPTVFASTCNRLPDGIAMGVKRKDNWKTWTYREYQRDVQTAAKSMIKLGLEPYHGVGIIGFNSPEWFIADLAAIHAGGFAVGVYTTNTPEACQYVASNCDANIIFVENDSQLQKIIKVKDQLPHLKAMIQWSGQLKEPLPNVYTWEEFMRVGLDITETQLQDRLKQQAPNKCCTLIYTSGTTGNPKGVMLSHDNVTWTTQSILDMAKLNFGKEVLISYLPLSHVAAQLLDLYIPMMIGGSVYFAQPDALKGSLVTTLKEVRPTAFLGVPRVWEKMQEKMKEVGKGVTGMKKKIADWAKDVGYRGSIAKMNGQSMPFGWGIANALAFKKVRAALGLDRARFCFTGAAPLMKETLDYFLSLDITLLEVYGMSESSGPQTFNLPWQFRIGSIGKDFIGATTKLADADAEGNGEICMGGRHVFMGYLGMEEKTTEAIDEDGWLHSGDIGKQDKDGYLFITGRIKELIITAGGENVPPVLIEDMVKEELPCVSNCMLIGDKKKFLSMLITFKSEVDPDTMQPLDDLSSPALDWCKAKGSKARSVSDILDSKDEAVLRGIQEGVDKANNRATSRAQKIAKWSILPRDFSTPGGELGPTLKLKRPVVSSMYTKTIDSFYAD